MSIAANETVEGEEEENTQTIMIIQEEQLDASQIDGAFSAQIIASEVGWNNQKVQLKQFLLKDLNLIIILFTDFTEIITDLKRTWPVVSWCAEHKDGYEIFYWLLFWIYLI